MADSKPNSVSEKDVKAPQVFERAKEEIAAILHTVKSSGHSEESHETNIVSEKEVKAPNVFERAKEEIEAVLHTHKSPRHHHETHGRSDDIDENTPIDEVKGPNVFERIKEEVEAVVQAIHPKKDGSSSS